MVFYIFMFIVTLLIPSALLLMWYLCPKFKTINNTSGYRTARSVKNQDTWEFAQKYCARISLYMFFPSLILAITIMPILSNQSIDIIGWTGFIITMFQMLSFVIIIISTEKALKKNFEDDDR
ncbi:SdpI family protein [Eubacteriales bacterium KG127]